jgi:hypothetical protein
VRASTTPPASFRIALRTAAGKRAEVHLAAAQVVQRHKAPELLGGFGEKPLTGKPPVMKVALKIALTLAIAFIGAVGVLVP